MPASGRLRVVDRAAQARDPDGPGLDPERRPVRVDERGHVRLGAAGQDDDSPAADLRGADRVLVGQVVAEGGGHLVEIVVDGWRFELAVEDADRADLVARATRSRDSVARSGPLEIRAIIPGRIAVIAVVAGDPVVTGDSLLVLEAMKMQNELRAPRDGTVGRVLVAPGDTVELGDVLLTLE